MARLKVEKQRGGVERSVEKGDKRKGSEWEREKRQYGMVRK